MLLTSFLGLGFIVNIENVFTNRRSGKQIFNLKLDDKIISCSEVNGDMIAIVGENRKLLVFSLSEIPELVKGKGVILQRYKDGGCSDSIVFSTDDGLRWKQSKDRQRTEKNIINWMGKRGGLGRMPPMGFPNPPKFK